MSLANILMASLLLPGLPGAARGSSVGGPGGRPVDAERSPTVAVWTNRDDGVFQRGDRMTVFVRTDVDAYVTVFRLDADGHARVLFPARPFDDSFVRGGTAHALGTARRGFTLSVQEYPGEGFLFAIVTLDPIALSAFARGGEWDYAALGLDHRITGDPYVLFGDLLATLIPETYPDYAYAVAPYSVGARHDYPRFLCYQCHAYVSPAVWNPYAHSCIRVRAPEALWWRYPFGAYGGTVVVAPPRPLPAGTIVAAPARGEPPRAVRPPARRPAPTTPAPKVTAAGRRPASPASGADRRPAPAPRSGSRPAPRVAGQH